MKYKVGDIIKLKNEAGLFQVEIKSKIPTMDAIRDSADDMVFEGKIIVFWIDTCNDEVEYYLGQIVQYEEKEDVFELMK